MGPEWVPVLVLDMGANWPPWVHGMVSLASLLARIWLMILIHAWTNPSKPVGRVIWYDSALFSSACNPFLKKDIFIRSLRPRIVARDIKVV